MAQQQRNVKLVESTVFDQYDDMVADLEVDTQMLEAAITEATRFSDIHHKSRAILDHHFGLISVGIHLKNLDRRMSTILCLLNQSYTQKSQRYVKVDEKDLENTHLAILRKTIRRNITQMTQSTNNPNYTEGMSMLSTEERLMGDLLSKIKNFYTYATQHDIPADDARYVLPLWCNTDMYMTITVPVLYDIYILSLESEIGYYDFAVLLEQILNAFPNDTGAKLFNIIKTVEEHRAFHGSPLNYDYDFIALHKSHPVQVREDKTIQEMSETLHSPRNSINAVSRAVLMSRNEDAEDKFKNTDKEKLLKTINSVVLGSGHTSILEHQEAAFTDGVSMSLSCIHQYIRHRHKTIRIKYDSNMQYRDPRSMKYYVPSSIGHNAVVLEMYREVMLAYKEYLTFVYRNGFAEYSPDYLDWSLALLPNAATFDVVTTTNFRELQNFFKDRLCMTASQEIRYIAFDQYRSLVYNNELRDILASMAPPCFRGLKCKEGSRHCDFMGEIFKSQKEVKDMSYPENMAVLETYASVLNQENAVDGPSYQLADNLVKLTDEHDADPNSKIQDRLTNLDVWNSKPKEVKELIIELDQGKVGMYQDLTQGSRGWRWAEKDELNYIYNRSYVLFPSGVYLVAADVHGKPLVDMTGRFIRLHIWDEIR